MSDKSDNNIPKWITKVEAARILGCSERTVDRKADEYKIRKTTQGTVVFLNESDVQRAKAKWGKNRGGESTLPVPMSDMSDPEKQPNSELISRNVGAMLLAMAQADGKASPPNGAVPITSKVYLTAKEAAEYSGLSIGYLNRMVKEKRLQRISTGLRGHRYRRVDIEKLDVGI